MGNVVGKCEADAGQNGVLIDSKMKLGGVVNAVNVVNVEDVSNEVNVQ